MTLTVLLAGSAYLFGSIPLAYILGKVVKGVDLRRYGSGAVTGSNAGELMGKWALVVVGCLDILKGAAPVWAAQYLGEGLAQQMTIGIAGVVGHNWPLYLNFQGGRGFTVVLGVLLAVARMELLLFTIIAVFGVTFSGNVPVVMGVSLLLLPFWSYALSHEIPLVWGNGIMAFIVFVKRLTGNMGRLPETGRGTVLLYRLLFDRDKKERDEWVRREDTSEGPTTDAAAEGPRTRRRVGGLYKRRRVGGLYTRRRVGGLYKRRRVGGLYDRRRVGGPHNRRHSGGPHNRRRSGGPHNRRRSGGVQ